MANSPTVFFNRRIARPPLIKVSIGFEGDRYYNAIKRRIASV
ncbi:MULTISPECIES: hypothetical protein [unclassified Microcoleus]